jgi:hypothetical protein
MKAGSLSTFCFYRGDLSKLLYPASSSSTIFNALGRTSVLQLYPMSPAVHSIIMIAVPILKINHSIRVLYMNLCLPSMYFGQTSLDKCQKPTYPLPLV